MLLIHSINTFIEKHNLIPEHARIVVGFSGGPDSVFLLHLLSQLRESKKITVIAAHVDHGWRPESGQEALFCQKMAQQLNIPYHATHRTELALCFKNNGSKEEMGRNMRRHFLEKIAAMYSANAIALAHHVQDQEENFFIRICRGTSITGLAGMRARQGIYIRPLLSSPKQQLLDYLHAHTIPYCIDQSNDSNDFLRNRIRTHVVPQLVQSDQRFHQNFQALSTSLQETDDFLEHLATQLLHEISVKKDQATYILIDALDQFHPAIQKRVLLKWLIKNNVSFTPSKSLFAEILRFLRYPGTGNHRLYNAWTIIKKNNLATIANSPF